jgi:hypothetical protein
MFADFFGEFWCFLGWVKGIRGSNGRKWDVPKYLMGTGILEPL